VDKAERVSFASGSAALTPEAKAILDEIARAICELPNPLLIGGHTDRTLFPSSSDYTNWELSTDRANAARRELQAACVKPEQIKRIVGYADTEPLIPDNPYAENNRRISITVMRLASDAQTKKDGPAVVEKAGDSEGAEPVKSNTKQVEVGGATKNQSEKKAVTVGAPDVVPDNVKVSKEPKAKVLKEPKPEAGH
jgi:hypothetical protein